MTLLDHQRTGDDNGVPPPRSDPDGAHDRTAESEALLSRAQGALEESHFCRYFAGGVALEKVPRGHTLARNVGYRLLIDYDGRALNDVDPDFEEAIWRVRSIERNAASRLNTGPLRIVIKSSYTLLIYLLRTVDGTIGAGVTSEASQARIQKAIDAARVETDAIDQYAESASRRVAIGQYMTGLVIGVCAIAGLMWLTRLIPRLAWNVADPTAPGYLTEVSRFTALCIMSGAVGALLSVMTRISNGGRVVVDNDQSTLVTIASGAFRPVIGAIFGTALFVLVRAHFFPLAVPVDETGQFFFVSGIAFLSGFSERWAQDTVVRSAPRVPVPEEPGTPT